MVDKKKVTKRMIIAIYLVALCISWFGLVAVKLGDLGFNVFASSNALRYECRECGSILILPKPEWVGNAPTNQDEGQKDGTGRSADAGDYNTFDYDNGLFIQVPPVSFAGLNSSAVGTTAAAQPGDEVPCGWPSRRTDSRIVTQACQNLVCPSGPIDPASNCANVTDSHTYPAIDVGLAFPVIATMSGTAYRCVNTVMQQTGSPSYGVYVVVENSPYMSLYAHMVAQPGDSGTLTRPLGTKCLSSDGESARWTVNKGDQIGYVGLTGDTTGYHSHYEIWKDSDNSNTYTTNERICPASYMDYSNAACQGGVSSATDLKNITSDLARNAGSFFSAINPLKEFMPPKGAVVNAQESLN
ncbi:M23 family metallopeptidase [candidate division WWE3 bacterium]|uniref:M23 family metallopeptidase n=1 Tax=candidate division WWE3 bacterium TaxID=2053526 RepID=A0A955RRN7_UNCKA|nr:M23 family metallopeptidase [candidate division WWE3 bacterium]